MKDVCITEGDIFMQMHEIVTFWINLYTAAQLNEDSLLRKHQRSICQECTAAARALSYFMIFPGHQSASLPRGSFLGSWLHISTQHYQ